MEQIVKQIFDAWQKGENSGNYNNFKTYLSERFVFFAHPYKKAKYQCFLLPKQIQNFNDNKPLTDYEVYLMLIGYTQTENYNPYNYNSIDNIYQFGTCEK